MESTDTLKQLADQFGREEWFHSTGLDQYGRPVVYVKHMNYVILNNIPNQIKGKQVLVAFSNSLTATRDQFVSNPSISDTTLKSYVSIYDTEIDISASDDEPSMEEELGSEEEEKSILYLQRELDKLEKVCGSFTLQDIFYEIQDGKNAVTNMSARFPEVRKELESLLDQYGFDIIYEELDG